MGNGWAASADAWVAEQGEEGDFGRRFVLDGPMLARVEGQSVREALDLGCGEGRFCRVLAARGIRTTGVDPTAGLLDRARARHPSGDYRLARAESLPIDDSSFDLVLSYLTLIDIEDAGAAIAEVGRVLRPGGRFLIANLNSFVTAAMPHGWRVMDGAPVFAIDHYLMPRAEWVSWQGIRVRNYHRPLSDYMGLLLGQGFLLRHFDEPAPSGGDPDRVERYRRVPWSHVMEWEKPSPPS